MMPRDHILAIDQGTTSSRSLIFAPDASLVATARRDLTQHYPADGWVEHDAEDIWRDTLATMRDSIAQAGLTTDHIAAIGITNQRETTLLWDRATGAPLYNAIVWQDGRTQAQCDALKAQGAEALVRARTGLLLDPYFSATKLAWLLGHVPGARDRAMAGDLAFGTIDSFLLWRLTGGRVHATDATNASRTLLFDIHEQRWCPDLLALFDIPASLLPQVRDSIADYGETDPALLGGAIPIRGIAGDQQAALVGQGCIDPGAAKITHGTGSFLLVNTGANADGQAALSDNRLLTTTGYRLDGKATYAVEGSIFVAGAAIRWLRDSLGILKDADDSEAMAIRARDNGGVYMVPAFAGLGAPWWRPEARGLICGLTLGTGADHIARAVLEAVAYQTADLIDAATADSSARLTRLRVDGGMAANDWLCQFTADICDIVVERPAMLESTAFGAAVLAGVGAGIWPTIDQAVAAQAGTTRFEPAMERAEREKLLTGWHEAVKRALT